MQEESLSYRFKALSCCVLMPTFNNENTLKNCIEGVLQYTNDIIIIDDGSTDGTSKILSQFPQLHQIALNINKGKGNALKLGFKEAVKLGYSYAITIDTDGQHFPSDLPKFISALEQSVEKNVLLIGDRNMNESDVLAQSAKGNRVSGFWIRTVTGLDLSDTQSGFRLYPLKALEKINFLSWTNKFEFETEVIVRSHWRGIKVKNIPIHILYPIDRVSHFRPFMDIARIVVLIIGFLIIKGVYIIPRDIIRKLKKKGFKKFLIEDFFGHHDSAEKKALSIALGIFIGLSPLWGFHSIIVIFLAIFLRLNKVVAFAFSNISLPPFIPFVLLASVTTGNWILGEGNNFSMSQLQDFDAIKHLESYMIGSIVLSTSMAIICGTLGYFILKIMERKKILAHG